MKHAFVVCKNETDATKKNAVLKGVKHLDNGDAVVTDGHRLYIGKAIHDYRNGEIVTPSGKKVKGEYPDIKRLLPTAVAQQEIKVLLADLYEAIDCVAGVGKVVEGKAIAKFSHNFISYKFQHVVQYRRELDISFDVCFHANAFYVLDALKLLKASNCESVTVRIYGAMRPFTLTNEDESLIALILPVRTY